MLGLTNLNINLVCYIQTIIFFNHNFTFIQIFLQHLTKNTHILNENSNIPICNSSEKGNKKQLFIFTILKNFPWIERIWTNIYRYKMH